MNQDVVDIIQSTAILWLGFRFWLYRRKVRNDNKKR